MATHSSTSAWRIPRTKEPSCPQSRVSQRVGHDRATNTHCIFIYSKKYTSLNLLTSIRNHYLRCLTNLPFIYFLFMYMCSVVFHSLQPHGLQSARLLCPCDPPARILEWVATSSQGSKPTSPALQAEPLPLSQRGQPIYFSQQENCREVDWLLALINSLRIHPSGFLLHHHHRLAFCFLPPRCLLHRQA